MFSSARVGSRSRPAKSSILGRIHCALAASLAVLASASIARASVWYVDDSAPPGGNGTSWPSAFADLQSALSATQPGDQIWVAEGTYRPSLPTNPADPRSASFLLPVQVTLFGGFLGYESSVALRAGSFDLTALDGDIGAPGSNADNAYHVVHMKGGSTFSFCVIDGFVVRNGNGLGSSSVPTRGAGVFLSLGNANYGPALELVNCTVRDNVADDGAGIANINLGHVDLKHCRVLHNTAMSRGGGYFGQTALITSVDTLWAFNTALQDGGAVFTNSTTLDWAQFIDDVMHDNSASRGGAIGLGGSQYVHGTALLECCTLAYNHAPIGGAIFVPNGPPTLTRLKLENSILWKNRAPGGEQIAGGGGLAIVVARCDVQGGWNGVGNLDVDPAFVDPALRDLRLRAGSRCIDAGDATLVPGDFLDLDGDGTSAEILPRDFLLARRFHDDPNVADSGVTLGTLEALDLGAFER